MVMMITVDILFAKGNVKLLTASETNFKKTERKIKGKKSSANFLRTGK